MNLGKMNNSRAIKIIVGVILAAGVLLSSECLRAFEDTQELARIHYAKARNYYRQGEYQKARVELEEVLELEPDHQGALWYLKHVKQQSVRHPEPFWKRIFKPGSKKDKEAQEETIVNAQEYIDKQELRQLHNKVEDKRLEQKRLAQEQKRKTEQARLEQKQRQEEKSQRQKQEVQKPEKPQGKDPQKIVRQKIKQHLARADTYLFQQKYDLAIKEVEKAFELEADNAQAKKFIRHVQKIQEKQRRKEEARLPKEQKRQAKEERLRLKQEAKARRLEEKRQAKEAKLQAKEAKLRQKLEAKFHRYEDEASKYYQRKVEPEPKRLSALPPKEGLEIKEQLEVLEETKEEQLSPRAQEKIFAVDEKLKKMKELYEKGKAYFQQSQYGEATACFEEVIQLGGKSQNEDTGIVSQPSQ